jgi:choline dehydrogenase-like flavoprotein
VRFKRLDGSEGRVQPRVLVAAANAMETPRLLLASRSSASPEGVANRSRLVGCNLMDHPIQLSWALAREPVWPYRGPGSTSGIENFRRSTRRATDSALRFEIGNEGWSWPTGASESTARELAMSGLSGKELDRALKEQTSRHLRIAALTEQLPLQENRVTLAPRLEKETRAWLGAILVASLNRRTDYTRAALWLWSIKRRSSRRARSTPPANCGSRCLAARRARRADPMSLPHAPIAYRAKAQQSQSIRSFRFAQKIESDRLEEERGARAVRPPSVLHH